MIKRYVPILIMDLVKILSLYISEVITRELGLTDPESFSLSSREDWKAKSKATHGWVCCQLPGSVQRRDVATWCFLATKVGLWAPSAGACSSTGLQTLVWSLLCWPRQWQSQMLPSPAPDISHLSPALQESPVAVWLLPPSYSCIIPSCELKIIIAIVVFFVLMVINFLLKEFFGLPMEMASNNGKQKPRFVRTLLEYCQMSPKARSETTSLFQRGYAQ